MVTKINVLPHDKSKDEKNDNRKNAKIVPLDYETNDGKQLVLSYASTTTLHGFKHTKHGTRFRRGFWVLVCLCMIVGLVVTIIMQTRDIFNYPTITKQTVQFKNSQRFPAVTLCNLNQFTKSYVDETPESRPILSAMSPISVHMKLFNLSDPLFDKCPTDVNGTKEKDMTPMLIDASHSLNDTIVKCTVDNIVVACAEIFGTVITDFGVCYTYNSRNCPFNEKPRVSFVPGNKYGLGLVMNVMQDEYELGESNDAAGIRVVLHDYNETPIIQARGFNIAPGFSTYAAIEMKEIQFLDRPFKAYEDVECVNISSPNFSHELMFSDTYDYNQCILECQLKYIVDMCGCRGMYDPVIGSVDYCTPRQYIGCALPNYDAFRKEGISDCVCPFPCHHVTYEARLSTASFPSVAVHNVINKIYTPKQTLEEYRRNYLELRIFYEKFVREVTEQRPQYNYESVLSTLGGQMGIFLGASVLSVIELLEFVLELIYVRCITWVYARRKTACEMKPLPVKS